MNVQQILAQLVSINSVFGNEAELANWLVGFLQQQGFTTEIQNVTPQRFNVLASRGNGKASLMCYGHIDTVPIYDGWQTNPLVLTQKEDKLYGLGACDMKGGIAGLLVALATIPHDLPLKVLFAVDEENASAGAWTTVNQSKKWLEDITHILSVEPGDGAQTMGGANTITLGRRGRARFKATIHGYSAHGAHAERGVNAISLASKLIEAINIFPANKHPRLGKGSQYVASINASVAGLSVPDSCQLEIERHLVMPETIQSCLREYRKMANAIVDNLGVVPAVRGLVSIEIDIVPRKNPYMMPYEVHANDPIVQKIAHILGSSGEITIGYGQSVADENVFAMQGISPIVIGPKGGNMHSPNEWISLNSLNQCAEVYKKIVPEMVKQELSS